MGCLKTKTRRHVVGIICNGSGAVCSVIAIVIFIDSIIFIVVVNFIIVVDFIVVVDVVVDFIVVAGNAMSAGDVVALASVGTGAIAASLPSPGRTPLAMEVLTWNCQPLLWENTMRSGTLIGSSAFKVR